MVEPCPVCKTESKIERVMFDGELSLLVDCPRCGSYRINDVTEGYLRTYLDNENRVATLSHAIRKMQKTIDTDYIFLERKQILHILENSPPKPSEQINNFILWLGDNLSGLGKFINFDKLLVQAEIGAIADEGVEKIIEYLTQKKLVEEKKSAGGLNAYLERKLSLSIDGWERYEELKHGSLSSRKAFMAMQYGDQEIDDLIENCFRPAVKATGFELYRLDDIPKAGLIDDRLRVEIRTSRFLIADLTHENRGAYWEAGYAEGLGKPVIYTCEKNRFEKIKPHFDTNHHTTVLWDKNNLQKTAQDLKSTIRATLPDEAILSDTD